MNPYPLCPVVPPLLDRLDALPWEPGGARPGEYAMIRLPGDSHEDLFAACYPVVRRCLELLPGRVLGMTLISRLIPGQRIDPHTDAHDGNCTVRVHVPLVTNESAVFITGGQEHHFRVGWAYVIDPTQEHAAFNGGTTDRVHLMFNARAAQ